MSRPRRPRLTPACVALVVLSGCLGPATSPATPTGSRRPGATVPGGGDPGAPTATPPPGQGSAGPSGLLPSVLPVATLPPPPLNVVSGKPVIRGTVFVPARIISNNGGSVIGNNGANVIGNNGANVIGNNGANVIGQNGANVIGQNGANVIGQNGASVIGQNGASVIGQNGANVIGQNGANVIGNNGANVIGNNGANVIGNNGANMKFAQYRVANAKVSVRDAAGQPIKDAAGQPVTTTTDNFGAYELPAGVVPTNAVIEVTSPELAGNTLSAYLPSDAAASGAAIDVDIASTLVISYVLDQYVKGDQALLDKLPRTLAEEAKIDLSQQLDEGDFEGVKVVEKAQVDKVLEGAIAGSAEVAEVFKRIEKLYVFSGITNNGDGQRATDIAIGRVSGLLHAQDQLFVMSADKHDLYAVGKSGVLKVLVPSGGWGYAERPGISASIDVHSGIAQSGNKLYLSDPFYHRVVSVENGNVQVIAGTGRAGRSNADLAAQDADLNEPSGLAILPDGTLIVADKLNHRLLRITADGRMTQLLGAGTETDLVVGMPASDIALSKPQGIALSDSGTLFVCDFGSNRVLEISFDGSRLSRLENIWSVSAPICVGFSTSGPIVASNSTGSVVLLGKSGVTRIDIEKFSEPGNPSARQASFPTALAVSGNEFFVDSVTGFVLGVLIDAKAVRVVAGGARLEGDPNLFNSALRFDVAPNGEILAVEPSTKKVFIIKADGVSRNIVAPMLNGVDFSDESRNPLSLDWDIPLDVKWRKDGAFILAVGGARPCIKLVKDGRVRNIAGNGQLSYDAFKSGPGTTVPLASPKLLYIDTNGELLIVEAGARRLLRLTAGGNLVQDDSWGDVTGIVSVKPGAGSAIVAVDRLKAEIVSITPDGAKALCRFNELPGSVAAGDVRVALPAANGDLYVATDTAIYRRRAAESVFKQFAGAGSEVLGGPARDELIIDLRDLAFHPNGDLLILEGDQVKRVPKRDIE